MTGAVQRQKQYEIHSDTMHRSFIPSADVQVH